ncbi:hypothetical protein SMA5143A_7137 [Streptomyces sp. MA5143a]|nr:hypothetical protein SMA5143A_7137 [Streptomyces sp. MA5143a]
MTQDHTCGDPGWCQSHRRIPQRDGQWVGKLVAHSAGQPGSPCDGLAAGPALGVVARECGLDAGLGAEGGGEGDRVLQCLAGSLSFDGLVAAALR